MTRSTLPPEPATGGAFVWDHGVPRRVPTEVLADGAVARTGTYDTYVWKEVPRSYGWLDMEGQVVLDVGANCGYFSALAVKRGAARVVGFEPEPHSMVLAQINAPEAELRQQALVRNPTSDRVELWLAPSGLNSGNSSLRAAKGRTPLEVEVADWDAVMNEVQPSVIKMDCEGAEYNLLSGPIPNHVKQIAMELHLMQPEWRAEALKVVRWFKRNGWECVKEPRFTDKNWTTLGGWRRG